MKKLTIAKQISISEIISQIQQFINKIKCQGLNSQSILKHKLCINESNLFVDDFLKNCILYCIIHQLKQTIQSISLQQLINISQKLREFYINMINNNNWKTQFYFQQSIIFITHLVSQFYGEGFCNVRVDILLMSQIFIILVYTLMGIKVSRKCYQILSKKYLKSTQKNSKISSNQRFSCNTALKKTSVKDNIKLSQISSNCNTLDVSLHSQNYQKQNKSPLMLDQIESFKNQLKQILYVKPLPSIKILKKSIQCFHRIKNNKYQSACNSYRNVSNNHSKSADKMPKYDSSLWSSQISLALKSQIKKRRISFAQYRKSVKIKHHPQYHLTPLITFKNNTTYTNQFNNQLYSTKEKPQRNKKLNSEQWSEVLRNIKEFSLTNASKNKVLKKTHVQPKHSVNSESDKNQLFQEQPIIQNILIPIKKNRKILQTVTKSSNKIGKMIQRQYKLISNIPNSNPKQSNQQTQLQPTISNNKLITFDHNSHSSCKYKKGTLKWLLSQKYMFQLQTKKRQEKMKHQMLIPPYNQQLI